MTGVQVREQVPLAPIDTFSRYTHCEVEAETHASDWTMQALEEANARFIRKYGGQRAVSART